MKGLRVKSISQLGKGAWKISADDAKALARRGTNRQPRRQGLMPQEVLWAAVKQRWPHAVEEYPAGVPGRRFRIDIAFPEARLAIEVDGYQHHGRFLEAHRSDRQRQNAMTLVGWRILRFTAGEARDPHGSCLAVIEEALSETPNLEAIGRLFRPIPAHGQKTKRSR